MSQDSTGVLSGLEAYDAIIAQAACAIQESLTLQVRANARRTRHKRLSVYADAEREVAYAIKQALEVK